MLLTAALLGAAGGAQAAPKLDPMFSNHAVVQRQQPVSVTGTAAPGEVLTVKLGAARASGRADAQGRFAVRLAPLLAGGPYTLEVTAPSGQAVSTDVLVGDVFLCSGQSNMELQVERAQDGYTQSQSSADDHLRLMSLDKATALTPQAALPGAPVWRAAGPASTSGFSAACFYMVKALREKTGAPIGAIAASWGGTQISAWMGQGAQRAVGRGAQADLLALYARDPAAAARQAGAAWETWWRAATGDAAGQEPWRPDAALDWRAVPKIDVWEHWGVADLAAYDGMVWFQKKVTLSAAQARQAATLSIGAVDDMDRTWVNGLAVGAGGNPGAARHYSLPPGVLRAGVNVITVNAHDVYANGGMTGPAEIMRLTLADGGTVALGTDWRYAVARRTPPNAPRAPWDDVAGAGTIYNAMIAPLGGLGLKGVAWYQGESDVDVPGYADRLTAMMADWRGQFAQPGLPFAIVQLSGFGAPAARPGPSGWASVREAQRRAVARDPHAALAVTIDLGDPLDIHPGEKHEVGRRLARAMGALAYGDPVSPSGPAAVLAIRAPDGGVVVTFTGVQGGLAARSSDHAIGFELCAAESGDCRYALATPSGARVVIAGDGRPVSRVRYGWADYPVLNLVDAASLPAGPFDIAVEGR